MNEIAILNPENAGAIISEAPQAYSENKTSHDKCIQFGQSLLDKINQAGMTDELDQQAAVFIDRARKTVKKMNDRRSPITKLFDDARKEFTALENEVDPTKKDTVPYQLQQLRNAYAAKKKEEADRKLREQQLEAQRQQAISNYRLQVEAWWNNQFNGIVNTAVNKLNQLNTSVTLASIDRVLSEVKEFPEALNEDFFKSNVNVFAPVGVDASILSDIRMQVLSSNLQKFRDSYTSAISDAKENIIMMLPGKKAELERMAQADAAEAARIREEMQKREAQEAARLEAERLAKQAQEAESAKMNQQANDLFAAAEATLPSYQPKSSVKKKIVINDKRGILHCINMWYLGLGQGMSIEELEKTFKKQITYCEKRANDAVNAEFINDPSITYVDEVKAK